MTMADPTARHAKHVRLTRDQLAHQWETVGSAFRVTWQPREKDDRREWHMCCSQCGQALAITSREGNNFADGFSYTPLDLLTLCNAHVLQCHTEVTQ